MTRSLRDAHDGRWWWVLAVGFLGGALGLHLAGAERLHLREALGAVILLAAAYELLLVRRAPSPSPHPLGRAVRPLTQRGRWLSVVGLGVGGVYWIGRDQLPDAVHSTLGWAFVAAILACGMIEKRAHAELAPGRVARGRRPASRDGA